MKTRYIAILFCFVLGILILFCGIVFSRKVSSRKISSPFTSEIHLPVKLNPTTIETPTNTQGQKINYTFSIIAESVTNNQNVVTVSQADTGQSLHVPNGTLIILKFGSGNFNITKTSPDNIFLNSEPEINLPQNAIGEVRVIHAGSGTITVTQTK